MDRLKLFVDNVSELERANLHSNMDRLKRLLQITLMIERFIYIPIWID